MKTKINNLDLAAYLVTKGYVCKVKHIHPTMGEFAFSEDLEKQVATFYKGDAQVNLLKYIGNRLMLKKALTDQGVKAGLINPSTNKYKDLWNTTYWYLDDQKVVRSNIFGKSTLHSARKDAGNYYKSEAEAKRAQLNSLNK